MLNYANNTTQPNGVTCQEWFERTGNVSHVIYKVRGDREWCLHCEEIADESQ